jgi:hypothetical protein
MGFTGADLLILGQPQPRLFIMWGSAARAQSQSTPGVSALAAPRTSLVPSAWRRLNPPC